MRPKLRPIDAVPIQHQGQPMLLLRDPLRVGDSTIAIPRAVAPVLALLDGTRDEAELDAAVRVRAGLRLAPGFLSRLLADLDGAYLLENDRYEAARALALKLFREAPYRPMTVDGSSLPPEPDAAASRFQGYLDALTERGSAAGGGRILGLISPHIDYQRGGPVYAEVWQAAREAAREADLVIVFGTDHYGSDGALTLTTQSYATPWGILRTDAGAVAALAGLLSPERAFAEELNHRTEHSVELAVLWLHFAREGKPVPLLPVLCGSFSQFVAGLGQPASHAPYVLLIQYLREVMTKRRTLVVAAADLAHVGPAFGDEYGLDFIGRAQLRAADQRLLAAVCAGDAESFFSELRDVGDRRHVCGLPPIYLTLKLLEPVSGEVAGYAQCPADPQGTSLVSVAGAILRQREPNGGGILSGRQDEPA